MLLGITKKNCGIISYVDTSAFSIPAQLALHYAFSFWIRFYGGSSTCISYIVLTKDYCGLCSSSQSTTDFFLIGSLSLNTCSLVTLLLVMAILTSTIWTEGFATLGFTTTCLSIVFTPLFLNIFYISLYLGQSMILCPVSPQIWQEYLIGLCILICWVITSEIARTKSSFLFTLHVSTLWFVLWQFVQYILVFSIIV